MLFGRYLTIVENANYFLSLPYRSSVVCFLLTNTHMLTHTRALTHPHTNLGSVTNLMTPNVSSWAAGRSACIYRAP